MEYLFEGYEEDPSLRDEDPEYREEMFQIYKAMGWTPEKLMDLDYRQLYAEWLKEQAK